MPFLSLFCIYIDILWWDICWKSMACQQMACDNDLWCYFLPLVSWPKPFFKVKFRADWNTQIPAQVQAVYLVFTFVVKRSHLLSKSLSASVNLLMCRKQHKNPRRQYCQIFLNISHLFFFLPPSPPMVPSEHSASPPAPFYLLPLMLWELLISLCRQCLLGRGQ